MVYKLNIYGDQWRQNYGRFSAILTRNWPFCMFYAISVIASIKRPSPSQRKDMILINARAFIRICTVYLVVFAILCVCTWDRACKCIPGMHKRKKEYDIEWGLRDFIQCTFLQKDNFWGYYLRTYKTTWCFPQLFIFFLTEKSLADQAYHLI